MSAPIANAVRGEASLELGHVTCVLRPSFTALVAAEQELGPLFELVERAAAGKLGIAQIAALFWHCRHDADPALTRDDFADALAQAGLVALTPALKALLRQILQGR